MKPKSAQALYAGRELAEGYPNLESLGVDFFAAGQSHDTNAPRIIRDIEREIGFPASTKSIAIIGCGPNPVSVKSLIDLGYDAKGVEPVAGHVEHAQSWLGDSGRIRQGSAESLPFQDGSQAAVLLESVLEHVDSPIKSVQEAYRVLAPGGVA